MRLMRLDYSLTYIQIDDMYCLKTKNVAITIISVMCMLYSFYRSIILGQVLFEWPESFPATKAPDMNVSGVKGKTHRAILRALIAAVHEAAVK